MIAGSCTANMVIIVGDFNSSTLTGTDIGQGLPFSELISDLQHIQFFLLVNILIHFSGTRNCRYFKRMKTNCWRKSTAQFASLEGKWQTTFRVGTFFMLKQSPDPKDHLFISLHWICLARWVLPTVYFFLSLLVLEGEFSENSHASLGEEQWDSSYQSE